MAEPVVQRDSAGLPVKPPPAPFAELPPEDDSDLKIYFGADAPAQPRVVRRLKRRARRARIQAEADNHDRWLISYSDFITLLFAFFVVMYAISQINESKYRVMSESLVQAFKPLGNLEARSQVENKVGQPSTNPVPAGVIPQAVPNPEVPKEVALPKLRDVELEARKALDPLIQTGDVRVLAGNDGLRIEMGTKVSFKTGEADPTFESFLPLRTVARLLARNALPVRVEGHTENETIVEPKRYPTQWELSAARASRVARILIDNGVDPQRLAATGYADTRSTQRAASGTPRVSILVLPMQGEGDPRATLQQGVTPEN